MKTTTKLMVYLTVGIIVALILVPPIVQNIQVGQNFQNYATLQNLLTLPNLIELQAEINVWRNNIDGWVNDTNDFIINQLLVNANNTAYITILLSFRDFITSWRDTVNSQLSNLTSWQSFIDTVVNTLNSWYNNVSSYVAQLPTIIDNLTTLIDWRTIIDNFVTNCTSQLSSLDSRVTALENQIATLSNSLGLLYTNVYLYTNGTHYIAVTTSSIYTSETFSGVVPYLTGSTVFVASGNYTSTVAVTLTNMILKGNSKNSVYFIINGQLTMNNVTVSGITFNITGSPSMAIYGANNKITDCNIYPTGKLRLTDSTIEKSSIYAYNVNQVLVLSGSFTIKDNYIEYDKDAYGVAAINIPNGATVIYGVIENNYINYLTSTPTNIITAFYFQGDSYNSIILKNNYVRGVTCGIYVYVFSSLNGHIEGNYFYGSSSSTGYGMDLQNAHNTTIIGNHINNFAYGIYLRNPCKNMVIQNNLIKNGTAVITDLNNYDGTYRNIIHDGYPRQLPTPTVTTQIIYNTYGTEVTVGISSWSSSSSVQVWQDEIWVYTLETSGESCTIILQAGESIRITRATDVTWIWFSNG